MADHYTEWALATLRGFRDGSLLKTEERSHSPKSERQPRRSDVAPRRGTRTACHHTMAVLVGPAHDKSRRHAYGLRTVKEHWDQLVWSELFLATHVVRHAPHHQPPGPVMTALVRTVGYAVIDIDDDRANGFMGLTADDIEERMRRLMGSKAWGGSTSTSGGWFPAAACTCEEDICDCWSHRNRWRLIVPFSRPATLEEYRRFMNQVHSVFPEMDRGCKQPDRGYYASKEPRWFINAEMFDPSSVALVWSADPDSRDQTTLSLPHYYRCTNGLPSEAHLHLGPLQDQKNDVSEAHPHLDPLEYLQTVAAPAVQGSSGSSTTVAVMTNLACLLHIHGREAELLELTLQLYNPRCQPPWSRGELEQKVPYVLRYARDRGWRYFGPAGTGRSATSRAKAQKLTPFEKSQRVLERLRKAKGLDRVTPGMQRVPHERHADVPPDQEREAAVRPGRGEPSDREGAGPTGFRGDRDPERQDHDPTAEDRGPESDAEEASGPRQDSQGPGRRQGPHERGPCEGHGSEHVRRRPRGPQDERREGPRRREVQEGVEGVGSDSSRKRVWDNGPIDSQ